MREVGKVMGLSEDTIATLVATVWGWRTEGVKSKHIREAGLDLDDKRLSLAIRLARELRAFPDTCHSMSAVSSSRADHCRTWCPSLMPPWKTGPQSNGTRTTSTRWAF